MTAAALQREAGAALIVGLILLTTLTLLSLAGMYNARLQERMAANLHNCSLAFQGAEAALREAEAYLQQSATDRSPFDGSTPGLIDRLADPGSAAYWSGYDWAQAARPVGPTLPGLAEPPRYVIEAPATIPAAGGVPGADRRC